MTTPKGSQAQRSAALNGAIRGRQAGLHGAFADQPHIAVGPDSVWVSFGSYPSLRSLSGVIQAFGAKVSGLGLFGSFSAPETGANASRVGDYGHTAVGPDGQVMVIY